MSEHPCPAPQCDSPATSNKFLFVSAPLFLHITNGNKYGLIIQTMLFAAALAILKACLVNFTTLETGYATLSDISLIFTGMFFITGVLLGIVMSDVKEAEKMPTDFVAYLELLLDHFLQITKKDRTRKVHATYLLMQIAKHWRDSLHRDPEAIVRTLNLISETTAYVRAIEGGSSLSKEMYVIAGILRRMSQRSSSLSRTDVIPAAHGLARFFALACTVLLFFVKYSTDGLQMMAMVCLYTVMWFVVRVVSSYDDPFEDEVWFGMSWLLGGNVLVHLYPLEEFAIRIMKRLHAKLPELFEGLDIGGDWNPLSVTPLCDDGDRKKDCVAATSKDSEEGLYLNEAVEVLRRIDERLGNSNQKNE